jgi:drug/metabolite transporter (DMT)-like permease
MKGKQTRAILWLVFIMLVWGSSYAVTKSVVNVLPPGCFSLVRFGIALICLLPVYLSERKSLKTRQLKPGDYWWLLLMGVTGVAFYYVFFNYSLLYTSASSGALIQGLIPICIALAGVLFLKERLSGLQTLGIALSFAGVILVGLIGANDQDHQSSLTGNLFMVISVLCWTAYTLISRKLSHLKPLVITFWSGCMGTILLVPISIYEFIHLSQPIQIDVNQWFALIYLGAISSALCYLLYNQAIEQLPAAVVGNFLNLDILIGVLIAVFFLHEQINVSQIIGGLLILSGLVLSSDKKDE